ncbi:MAG: flagellar biosynthesis regulator FlaF [Deltaproteobacteria bacterium]|nr:flagellar biosynthesis regulator FlaF [Deltaproteobacteria bacterium]
MYANQLQIYKNVSKSTMSGREIEAAVLTKAAFKLKDCQENWNAEDRNTKLDEALKFNQLIWSIFQGELARPDNPLPKTLRQDILSLSAFIDKRIFETMAYPAPEKLTPIININLNLAAGLKGKSA